MSFWQAPRNQSEMFVSGEAEPESTRQFKEYRQQFYEEPVRTTVEPVNVLPTAQTWKSEAQLTGRVVPETQFYESNLSQHPAFRPLLPATEPIFAPPPVVERKNEPAIVQESIKNVEQVEVQPVIDRQRDRVEIRPMIRPVRERVVTPVTVEESRMPMERREIREQGGGALEWRPASLAPSRTVLPTRQEKIVQPPIVRETVKTRIIEDVQPVIEREVLQTRVIKTMKPIHEHVIENPRLVTTQYEEPQVYTTEWGSAPEMVPKRQTEMGGYTWPMSGRYRRYV